MQEPSKQKPDTLGMWQYNWDNLGVVISRHLSTKASNNHIFPSLDYVKLYS